MATLRYPIGQQTFSKLIEEGFTYVDKTAFVARLVETPGYFFLSRPRRFGKSLLLSTLKAYFEGRRDLFKGLAIDAMDLDWNPTPVLHFDFNVGQYFERGGMEARLNDTLRDYEAAYNIEIVDENQYGLRFGRLIKEACRQSGHKIAILIDEYDKPLLCVEDNPELFAHHQELLKSFYGALKSMDDAIRFVMITGVARFNKVSIFSDLNNLYDISISDTYADICGWTEQEVLHYFLPGIEQLAAKRCEPASRTVDTLRCYYDGYRFAEEGDRLYNPFSVLTALADKKISPYWFRTGTPDFLAKRVRKYGIPVQDFNGILASDSELISVGMDTGNPAGLMFQTGYLTIDSYDARHEKYRLRFPNREVEIGFADFLYPLYVNNGDRPDSQFNLMRFRDDLFDGNPEGFMTRLQTLIKDLPYDMQNENNYQSIVWLLGTLCATSIIAERHSYYGRSDLEIITPDYIYVFEFKFNSSPQEAIQQIHERDYAGRFALDPRPTFLIGANFCSNKDNDDERKPRELATRGLTGWIIESMNPSHSPFQFGK